MSASPMQEVLFNHRKSSQTDLWSSQLIIYMARERSSLNDFRAWIRRHTPPICTFMPDRVHEPNANAANQKSFASLSRILLLNQMVSPNATAAPGVHEI